MKSLHKILTPSLAFALIMMAGSFLFSGCEKPMVTSLKFGYVIPPTDSVPDTLRLYHQHPIISWSDNTGMGWITVDPNNGDSIFLSNGPNGEIDIYGNGSYAVSFTDPNPPPLAQVLINLSNPPPPSPPPPPGRLTSGLPQNFSPTAGTYYRLVPQGPLVEPMTITLIQPVVGKPYQYNCTYTPNGGPPSKTIMITVTCQ
jgi:hypothetical protein